jgi:hypothetical protein
MGNAHNSFSVPDGAAAVVNQISQQMDMVTLRLNYTRTMRSVAIRKKGRMLMVNDRVRDDSAERGRIASAMAGRVRHQQSGNGRKRKPIFCRAGSRRFRIEYFYQRAYFKRGWLEAKRNSAATGGDD